MIRVDVRTPEGNCEFNRQNFTHTPTMMYITASGKVLETTDSFLEKDQLQQKLENILKQP